MRRTLSVRQVARLAGCSTPTVRKFCDEKRIFSTRDHNKWRRIPIQEAERFCRILDGTDDTLWREE